MTEQSRHAKEFIRISHSTKEVTEVKRKTLVFLLSNKQMLSASMIFWITLLHWMLGDINLDGTASHYEFFKRLWLDARGCLYDLSLRYLSVKWRFQLH